MNKDDAIPESYKPTMLLSSIDPKGTFDSTAATLRTKDTSGLTWEYVATTLIDEYNVRKSTMEGSGRSNKITCKC